MIQNKTPRVLITYVEAGMGHIVTAQAISDSLKSLYGDRLEIIDSYTLRDSSNPSLPKYEKFLVNEVKKHSAIHGYCAFQMAAMHISGTKNSLKIVHETVFHKETHAVIEEYKKYSPDIIVNTHYFTLYAAIEYRNKVNPNCKVVLYCPDNNVHGWWDNRVDRLYTNNPLATADALENKFPPENVLEVFYPTRTAVSQSNESKEFYREKFGIPKDKFAVVIADGVYAKAMTAKVTEELLKTDIPLSVCVVAGKNEKLYNELKERVGTTKPNVTLIPFGFVTDAPQLYGACDLFITKSGPNAVLDSVMMGTPVIIDYYGSPIEQATKRLFIDTKECGYYVRNVSKIRETVERLSVDSDELSRLRENLKFFDKHKNGADQIARDIATLVGLTEPSTV